MVLAAAWGSCAAPDENPGQVTVEELAGPPVSWESYRDQARQAGGETGAHVAEWDLVFGSESDLRDHFEENLDIETEKLAAFKRLSTGYEPIFSRVDRLDLVYCVSTLFPNHSTVVTDMTAATQAWQRVINVRFRYDATQNSSCDELNSNVDLAVTPTTYPGLSGCSASKLIWSPLGCPKLVSGVLVGYVRGVLQMQYGLIPGAVPADQVTPSGVMQHELGHFLGFRHEHAWASAGCEPVTDPSQDVTGRQITSYDQLSVMHYPLPLCGGIPSVDFSVSRLDGIGARSVYKIPAAWHVPLRLL